MGSSLPFSKRQQQLQLQKRATSSSSSSSSSSPPIFGLRFWLTCCVVSFLNHAAFCLYKFQATTVLAPAFDDAANSPGRSLRAKTYTNNNNNERRKQVSIIEQQQQQQPLPPQQSAPAPAPPPPLVVATPPTKNTVSTDPKKKKKKKKKEGLSSEEEAKYWSENSCIYVENLCHSTYRFFYATPDDDEDTSGVSHFEPGHDSTPWQPNLELDLKFVFAKGYPTRISVGRDKPAELQPHRRQSTKCLTSPVSHHLMYSTPFNDMLVEFYIRTMTGFKKILLQHAHLPEQHLQMYLILYNHAKILDGHRLLTNTLPTSNPLLPFQSLMDTTKCQCMAKAIFCGFKNTTAAQTSSSSAVPVIVAQEDHDGGDGDGDDEDKESPTDDKSSSNTQVEAADASSTSTNATITANTTTTTTTSTEDSVALALAHNDTTIATAATAATTTTSVLRPFADILGGGIYRQKRRYPGLRKMVRTELFDGRNGLINSLIHDYRWKQIRRFRKEAVESEIDDYILVGLAQRNGRRRWSNLNPILRACNRDSKFREKKILCIEVNMDYPASHVLQQAVIHGSLQAFVGIHGSHFVNAVMLPKGSTILEMLPWFPDWMRFGREWARRTDIATPIGGMFFNSDLNHVGIALERSTAPQLCSNETMGSVEDEECLYHLAKKDKDAVWWGTRDFSVPWSLVQTFLQQFVLPGPTKPDLCRDFLKIQDNPMHVEGTNINKTQAFALYNVNCREEVTSTLPHTFHSYTNYTVDEEARLKALIAQGRDKPPSQRKTRTQEDDGKNRTRTSVAVNGTAPTATA